MLVFATRKIRKARTLLLGHSNVCRAPGIRLLWIRFSSLLGHILSRHATCSHACRRKKTIENDKQQQYNSSGTMHDDVQLKQWDWRAILVVFFREAMGQAESGMRERVPWTWRCEAESHEPLPWVLRCEEAETRADNRARTLPGMRRYDEAQMRVPAEGSPRQRGRKWKHFPTSRPI